MWILGSCNSGICLGWLCSVAARGLKCAQITHFLMFFPCNITTVNIENLDNISHFSYFTDSGANWVLEELNTAFCLLALAVL